MSTRIFYPVLMFAVIVGAAGLMRSWETASATTVESIGKADVEAEAYVGDAFVEIATKFNICVNENSTATLGFRLRFENAMFFDFRFQDQATGANACESTLPLLGALCERISALIDSDDDVNQAVVMAKQQIRAGILSAAGGILDPAEFEEFENAVANEMRSTCYPED